MRPEGTGTKAQRDQLRRQLLAEGYTYEQIADEMRGRWGFRPRIAWRYAYGWTQDEVAARYNQATNDPNAAMTDKRISGYEKWPDGGIKPTLGALRILANTYSTVPAKLVDYFDRQAFTNQERLAIQQSGPLSSDAPSVQPNISVSGPVGNSLQARNILGGVHFHDSAKAPGPTPHLLPGEVRNFVNRVIALERLDAVLAEYHRDRHALALVLITGTAGVGKTSLAVYWSHRVREQFPDGSLYVDLCGYGPEAPAQPTEVLVRFLRALGVPAADIPHDLEDRVDQYRSMIAERRILVVLDNAATIKQVRPLLPGVNSPLVLVTSRNRLSGLAARDGALRLPLNLLTEAEAVDLLQSTIQMYRPANNADDIAQLARLCDRLPLALRIAAERAASRPMMPLKELIGDLREESSLWDALSLEDEDEANAVRSVFAWSYRNLSPDAARLFRLLGVHPGLYVSVDAAAALCGLPAKLVRGLLDLLAGAHLLERTGPDRYQFHDLLRAYAGGQAQQGDHEEITGALGRVLSWYLHSAAVAVAAVQTFFPPVPLGPAEEGVTPRVFRSADEAIAWYESEAANLRAAAHAAAVHGFDQITWQLPAVLLPIHAVRNPFDDWFALGHMGLEAARRVNDRHVEALMLTTLGVASSQSGRLDDAARYLSEASAGHHETGDRFGEIDCVNALGWVHLRARRLPQAIRQFEHAGALASQYGYSEWGHIMVSNLATTQLEAGDLQLAADYAHRALAVMRETRADKRLEFDDLLNLARIYRELGQPEEAAEYLALAVSVADTTSPSFQAHALLEECHQHRLAGRFEDAMAACQQAAVLYRTLPDRYGEAQVLDAVGSIYGATDRPDQAAGFHGRAAAIFSDLDRRFDHATALDHLAETQKRNGNRALSQVHWDNARSLLTEFDDARANALKLKIQASRAPSGDDPGL